MLADYLIARLFVTIGGSGFLLLVLLGGAAMTFMAWGFLALLVYILVVWGILYLLALALINWLKKNARFK